MTPSPEGEGSALNILSTIGRNWGGQRLSTFDLLTVTALLLKRWPITDDLKEYVSDLRSANLAFSHVLEQRKFFENMGLGEGLAQLLAPQQPLDRRGRLLSLYPGLEPWLPVPAKSVGSAEWKSRSYRLKVFEGVVELATFLTAAYPDRLGYDVYYLARDGQLPFYAAKFLGLAKNHHLINVSKHTTKDGLLQKYLEQEGVLSRLRQGRKVVLFDIAVNTGRNMRGILDQIPVKYRHQVTVRTLVSGVEGYSQSRSFFARTADNFHTVSSVRLHDWVDHNIESKTPKGTCTSYCYKEVDGVVIPFSDLKSDHGWGIGKDPAGERKMLEDLRWWINENKDSIAQRKRFWSGVFGLSHDQLLAKIPALLRDNLAERKAAGADLLEMLQFESGRWGSRPLKLDWIQPRGETSVMFPSAEFVNSCERHFSL